MSEEEKEAIDYLENQDNSVNWNYPTLRAILGALNYIDKLQKENEVLHQQIDLEFVEENFIEKDKVVSKDKIRKIRDKYNKYRIVTEDKEIYERYVNYLDVIDEILEEE